MNLSEESNRLSTSCCDQKLPGDVASNDVNPLLSPSSNSSDIAASLEAICLKRELIFFFKNPIEKWHAKKKLPYKFAIQVIKIVLVTFQLCIFAESRYKHLNYAFNSKISFSHLFLYNWDSSREVLNYPPEAGPFAIYRINEFYKSFNYIFQEYGNLANAVGPYSYMLRDDGTPASIKFCIFSYRLQSPGGDEDVKSGSVCRSVSTDITPHFSAESFFRQQNITLDFNYVEKIEVIFLIKANVKQPDDTHCSTFEVNITYNNRNMDGQLLVDLFTTLNKFRCNGESYSAKEMEVWQRSLNVAVILVCTVSLLLCSRSLYRAQLLKYKTMEFFRRRKEAKLSVEGRLEFWNFWYIMIIINDVLIIIGSYLKGLISKNDYSPEEWSLCSLCLGTGTMLVWFGVLRYFGFFKTYNVVMLTLKKAFPKMMRFLICTLIIYAGFVFCGWLVLGPFHIKFRSISRTSENLFSLVNGDDMFATFTILETSSPLIWWYSRIYLYSFISLFIYIVLNLFLSVILDAYETIKEYYANGFPKSDLHHFISELNEDSELIDDSELIGDGMLGGRQASVEGSNLVLRFKSKFSRLLRSDSEI